MSVADAHVACRFDRVAWSCLAQGKSLEYLNFAKLVTQRPTWLAAAMHAREVQQALILALVCGHVGRAWHFNNVAAAQLALDNHLAIATALKAKLYARMRAGDSGPLARQLTLVAQLVVASWVACVWASVSTKLHHRALGRATQGICVQVALGAYFVTAERTQFFYLHAARPAFLVARLFAWMGAARGTRLQAPLGAANVFMSDTVAKELALVPALPRLVTNPHAAAMRAAVEILGGARFNRRGVLVGRALQCQRASKSASPRHIVTYRFPQLGVSGHHGEVTNDKHAVLCSRQKYVDAIRFLDKAGLALRIRSYKASQYDVRLLALVVVGGRHTHLAH